MKKPKNDSRKLGRLEEKILKVFKSQPETPLRHKEVVKKLGDANYPQDKIFDALNALLEYKSNEGIYCTNSFKISQSYCFTLSS